jgi:hypothetical protein
MLSLVGLSLGFALVAPQPAFARMHFTDTNQRLDALTTRANSSVNLTNPADIQTQLNEITTQAQAAKSAAEDAAQRPASNAEDKSVLSRVSTDMDAVVASAAKAKTATGADQQTALKDIQSKSQGSLKAVQDRIAAQQAAPAPQASPPVLPTAGEAAPGSEPWSVLGLGLVFVVGGLGLLGLTRLRRPV